MKARFGSGRSGGVSFFAFQDIITGIAGFLIVIAIFLALNLDQVVLISTDKDRPGLTLAKLKEVLEEVAQAKAAMADLQKQPAMDESALRRAIDQYKAAIAALPPSATGAAAAMANPAFPLGGDLALEREKALTALRDLEEQERKTAQQVAEAARKLPALENEVKDATGRVQAVRDRANVLRLIPERTDTTKEPVLVLVEGARVKFQTFDQAMWREAFSPADFLVTLGTLSPSRYYVVFYFKPSGAVHFDRLTISAREAGFEIGYDVVPENIEVEFRNAQR